jgi:hypothetical protein
MRKLLKRPTHGYRVLMVQGDQGKGRLDSGREPSAIDSKENKGKFFYNYYRIVNLQRIKE